jgi:CRISPR/Cas system-associated endonuclease Cas1
MRRSKAKIRIKAISKGYDPTIGVMHDGSDGSLKFIFDLMELERPKSIVPCWISSRRTSSIQRILSFGRTAYVDLTRKWRGCWWRGFRHRAATAGIDVKLPLQIAALDGSVGRIAGLRGSRPITRC